MAAKPKEKPQQEEEYYGPKNVAPGEEVFGVCHIYASFNDTFVVSSYHIFQLFMFFDLSLSLSLLFSFLSSISF
jgi:hypothetical protein